MSARSTNWSASNATHAPTDISMIAAVDMLLEHAEHLPIRSFTAVVERWLMWADPDGAWRDQTESIDHRTAHVVAANGEVSIGASGGDALTAEKLRNIFAHFVELEFRKDCEARRATHGDRADEFPLPRTDAQRRFDALVAIFERAYAATADGKLPDPVVNIVCDQRTLHDLLGRAGIVLADGEMLDLDDVDQRSRSTPCSPSSSTTRPRCSPAAAKPPSGQQIAPQLLIQALLTAQVRRVVLDANSTVIDLGERKRLFTGNARIAATLLEQHCQHPGCEVPGRSLPDRPQRIALPRWSHRPGQRRPGMRPAQPPQVHPRMANTTGRQRPHLQHPIRRHH